MKQLLFIYNPVAGRQKVKAQLASILDIFAAEGYLTTVFPTRQGIQPKICCKRAQQFAAYLRLYMNFGAAAAAPRAFPQVAIVASGIGGYTTANLLQSQRLKCSIFAVV